MNLIMIVRHNPLEKRIAERFEDHEMDRLSKIDISAALLLGALTTIFLAFFPVFGVEQGMSAFEIGFLLFFFAFSRTIVFLKTPTKVDYSISGLFLSFHWQ
jgi:hypothetical protein